MPFNPLRIFFNSFFTLVFVSAAALGIAVCLYDRQLRKQYLKPLVDHKAPVQLSSESAKVFKDNGLGVERVTVKSDSNQLLGIRVARDLKDEKAPHIIFLADSRKSWKDFESELGALALYTGANVWAVDTRGKGGNPGRPTPEGLIRDVEEITRHIQTFNGTKNKDIFILAKGASAYGALGKKSGISGVICENAFVNDRENAATHCALRRFGKVVPQLVHKTIDIKSKAAAAEVPALYVCGHADTFTNPKDSDILFKHNQKTFLLNLKAAGHDDCMIKYPGTYLSTITQFMKHTANPDTVPLFAESKRSLDVDEDSFSATDANALIPTVVRMLSSAETVPAEAVGTQTSPQSVPDEETQPVEPAVVETVSDQTGKVEIEPADAIQSIPKVYEDTGMTVPVSQSTPVLVGAAA